MLRRIVLATLLVASLAGTIAACVGDAGDGTAPCTGDSCNDGGGSDVFQPAIDGGGSSDAGPGMNDAGSLGDGSCTHPCNGEPAWVRGFGSTTGDVIYEVKVDGAGNMYVLGSAGGPFQIGADGGGPSVASGPFVMKLDKDGNALWSKALGGTIPQMHIAISNTALYVAGVYFKNAMQTGNITWGGADTTLPTNVGAPNGYDIFVLETDLDGNQLTVAAIGAAGYDELDAVGVDSDGSPIIYGSAAAQITFGGKTLNAGPFVLEMTTALTSRWVCTIGVTNINSGARAKAIGSLPGQGVYVAGRTLGNVTWCGQAIGGGTNQAAFVLHLQSSDGSLAAGNSNPNFAYGNGNISQTTDLTGLAIGTNDAGAGGVYFAGSFEGSVSIGSPSQQLLADDGGVMDNTPASYIGLFDKGSNLALTSRLIIDNPQSKYALAVDPFGGVALAGFFKGTVGFGGALPLVSAGDTDGVIALYDPLLKKPTWSYRMGGPITDAVVGVGSDALGNIYAAGQWQGTGDFPGGKTLMSNGGVTNLFVMKLAH